MKKISKMKPVVVETYKTQVKSWSFVLMIISPFITMFLMMFISNMVAKNTKDNPVAIISSQQVSQGNDEAKQSIGSDFKFYVNEHSAKKDVDKGKLEGYILVSKDNETVSASYKGNTNLSKERKNQIFKYLESIQNDVNQKHANLSDEQVHILDKKPILKEHLFDVEGNDKKSANSITFYILVLGLYFLVTTYSNITAYEIAKEKGGKVVEIILSSIDAKSYFLGRIIGIFAAILTHIGAYVILGSFAFLVINYKGDGNPYQKIALHTLKNMDWSVLIYIILGLFLYVILSAFCGALVKRIEDASRAVQPISYMAITCFFIATAIGRGNDSILLKVLSYIPFSSPFFMPLRILNGNASIIESLISLLLLLTTIYAFIFIISKRYSDLILQKENIGFFKALKKIFL